MSSTQEARFAEELERVLHRHPQALVNPERPQLIRRALEDREAIAAGCGALATWTATDSTGRSPNDTYSVRNPETEGEIDWDSPHCIPLDSGTFDQLWQDALEKLAARGEIRRDERACYDGLRAPGPDSPVDSRHPSPVGRTHPQGDL